MGSDEKLTLRTDHGSFVTLEHKPAGKLMVGVSVTMSRVGETYVSTLLSDVQVARLEAFLLEHRNAGHKVPEALDVTVDKLLPPVTP